LPDGDVCGERGKSAAGRADVVIRMQDTVYVLEFKYDGTAREALDQINSLHYVIPYCKDGRRIVKVGINLDRLHPYYWRMADRDRISRL